MSAPEHIPCAACDAVALQAWRTLVDETRQNMLAALRDAIEAGVPLDELKEDAAAFERAMSQLLAERGAR